MKGELLVENFCLMTLVLEMKTVKEQTQLRI